MVNNNSAEQRFTELMPDIEKVAQQLARKYRSLELEDIQQDLSLYAWKNIDKIRLYGEEGGNPRLILSRQGNRLCGKQMASRSAVTDEYYYLPAEVRGLLESGALWIEQDDVLGRSDLLTAFQELDERDQEAIKRGILDSSTADKGKASALRSAVQKLAYKMNGVLSGKSTWHQDRMDWTGSKNTVSTTIDY